VDGRFDKLARREMSAMIRLIWSRPATRAAACGVALMVMVVAAAAACVGTAEGAPTTARAGTAGRAAAAGRAAMSASAPKCAGAGTQVWLGLGLGGGTAGSTYYPLEFSNVGRHACTLTGYPGVSAYRSGGAQVGPAATRNGQPHGTVTLAPGATAHAILRILDWGALCSKEVVADGLRVFPPGETSSKPVPFSFGACAGRGVLIVGPVRAGVGIPGYTTS
jgi:Protein of unknown function (DUF4232)